VVVNFNISFSKHGEIGLHADYVKIGIPVNQIHYGDLYFMICSVPFLSMKYGFMLNLNNFDYIKASFAETWSYCCSIGMKPLEYSKSQYLEVIQNLVTDLLQIHLHVCSLSW